MLIDKMKQQKKAYVTYFLKEDGEIAKCPYLKDGSCDCTHFLYDLEDARVCSFGAIDVRERNYGKD